MRGALRAVGAIFAVFLIDSCGGKDSTATERGTELKTASGIPMIYVDAAKFKMGTNKGNADERPAHRVSLQGFLMDKTEVTHAMFTAAELPNPSHWKDDPNKPVESLRWRDAKLYCNERSLMEGLTPCYDEKKPGLPCNFDANGYRLPTEAEWEFAALAGSDRDYDFGTARKLKHYAFYGENGQKRTHPVGTKKPNAFGFHGLYGNVSEWCQDAYDADYYQKGAMDNPSGPKVGAADVKRAVRGGSWKASARMCRAHFRQGKQTGDTDACFTADFLGFRCVRRITEAELAKLRSP